MPDDAFILRSDIALPPVPDVSLGTYIAEQVRSHGDRVAQVDAVTGVTATYAAILERSLRLAEALRRRGVVSGDVIAVCSENNLEFCLPVLGALYLGATCATLNPSYTARELRHALLISKPVVVFCSAPTAARVRDVIRDVGVVREVVVFGTPSFSGLLDTAPPPGRPGVSEGAGPADVAAILCSSGTTGLAKGVMLTGRNILTSLTLLRQPGYSTLTADDVSLGILPYFHSYGFVSLLASLCLGLKIVVMPRFEDRLFLRSIQDHKVTFLTLVPPLMVFLAKHPIVDKYDLSSVKTISCGAAPLSQDTQEQVMRRLGIKMIRQGYGMTETTLGVLATPLDHNKAGSSGKLVPGTVCKVVDLESGRPVGPHVSGELCFKGPLVMKGYCGDLQATSACTDRDGFLHTGDVGYYDRDGFFFIVDRLKELIKYKGFQVPPAELEAILLTHPAIQDAAVIGIPDEAAGELPLAFVVRQASASITEQDIVQFVQGQVSPQKRLHGGVRFVDSIPKNPSGKILRRELRDMLKSKL